MKLSEAKTIDDVIQAIEEKLQKQWYYPIKYEQYEQFLVFHVACPTDAFDEAQKKAKKKIKVTEKMLHIKDMFILDHVKVDLCNIIDPYKKDAKLYRSKWKKVLKEIM